MQEPRNHRSLSAASVAPSDSDTQGPVFWERLQQLFASSKEEPDSERPQRRGAAIFICLAISSIWWFYVTLTEEQTATIELPTRVVNLRADEALTQVPPDRVRVQVRGEGIQMLRLAISPPAVPINASGEEVNLRSAVGLDGQLDLINVFPQFIDLRKEPRVSRRIPVRLRADLQVPPTHDLIEPARVEPDSVVVSGAGSIVDSLRFWPTDSVVVSNATDSLIRRVALADTLQGLVRRGIDVVLMTAQARQFTEGERVIDVRVPGSPDGAITLEPPTVTVRYRVPVDQYQQSLGAQDFFAMVPYDVIRADTTGRVTPQVQAPAYLNVRDVQVRPSYLDYYYNVTPGRDAE